MTPWPAAKQIPGLVKDLDSDDFATRENASRLLEKVGRQAEAELKRALEGDFSLEGKRRARALLEKMSPAGDAPAVHQQLRALEVLESAATAEARELLQSLSTGDEETLLARQARAAVERLKSRVR